jgi:hypothetical protein
MLAVRRAIYLGLLAVSAFPAQAQSINADAVIARTKHPAHDYSLFQWTNVTTGDGRLYSFWAAEFHQGSLHRVETPMDRIVADCAAMTGTHYSEVTGETTTGRAAAETACGIDMTGAEGAEYLGRRESDYGILDAIEIARDGQRRTYWISPEGVIIRSQFARAGEATSWVLRNWAIRLELASPNAEMFTASSLTKTYVPAALQVETEPEYAVGFIDE